MKTTVFKLQDWGQSKELWWVAYAAPGMVGFTAYRYYETWDEAIRFAFRPR